MNYNLKKKMIKKIFKSSISQKILGLIIAYYLKICYHTSSWKVKNENTVKKVLNKKQKVIVCFWHSKLLMTVFCWKYENEFKMLISAHRDGKIISNAVSYFGIKTISGSSRKNKISSLKEIMNQLQNNKVVGITPDGPKGPKEKIKDGLISLLKKTDAVILPLSYSAKIYLRLNTWDKFLLIFPFNKFVAVWGNPLKYNSKKSLENNRKELQKEFQRIENLAENLLK